MAEKKKLRYTQFTDRELLENLYYRAGWILFWAVIAALAAGSAN